MSRRLPGATKTKRIAVTLPWEQWEELQRAAVAANKALNVSDRRGRSRRIEENDVVRAALRRFVPEVLSAPADALESLAQPLARATEAKPADAPTGDSWD
jgi:hypothetical protein